MEYRIPKAGRTVNLNTELVEDRYKRKFVIRKRRRTMEGITEKSNERTEAKTYLVVVENDCFVMCAEEQCLEKFYGGAEMVKKRMWVKQNIVKLLWFMINETYAYEDVLELETDIRKERFRLELKRIGEEDVGGVEHLCLSEKEELDLKSKSKKVLCILEMRNNEMLIEKIVYQAEDYPISRLPEKVVKLFSPKTYTLLVAIEKLLEEMKEEE